MGPWGDAIMCVSWTVCARCPGSSAYSRIAYQRCVVVLPREHRPNLNHRHELLPAVEERFRGIGEGWARFTYGGSTGGWEALAVQLMYPDDLNGCYAACPDSISFEA